MKKLLLSLLLAANSGVIAAPFVVKDIRIDGVQEATGKSIISTLPVKVGQRATDSDVANLVRQLFLQNQFADVSVKREGDTLVIKVLEKAVISRVDIEGNSAIPKEPLEQNLKSNLITKGEIFDRERLESFKGALLEHYKSIGRYAAKVDMSVTENDERGIDVKLVIDEGEIAYVKTINFEGNEAFSAKELTKKLEIQPDVAWWNIFQSSKFEQNVYAQDIENLRDFYLNQGYARFDLTATEVDFSENNTDVTLTYKLNEGKQYNVSEIRIVGNTAGLTNELQRALDDFKPGQQFRKNDILKIEEEIKKIFGDVGYGTAKVDLYPIFDDENQRVRINFVVDAGRRIYVRKIAFEGNDVTADSTLRREMRQQEGAWLSTSAVLLGKERLERTGFYESVELSYPAVKGVEDQVDLLYKIRERNTGSISFGIGYGTESGISYQAGIKQDNFLGMGSTISLNGQRNDYGTSINLGYTEPYFTKDGVSLGGNVFYEDFDNSKNDTAATYKRQTYGISGTLGFPVNEHNSYYIGLGYTHDLIKNAQREFNRELYVNSMNFDFNPDLNFYPKIKTDDFDLSFGWNYNSLNRGFFPTEGATASIGGRVTTPGSDNKYYKLSADYRHYYPLNRDHKWGISTKAGISYANGFGGKALPFYQTYTAGGIGSLRGFSYGAIGPTAIYRNAESGEFNLVNGDIVGGNALAAASLELIMPTPFVSEKYQHNVRTTLFVDAASVWNTKWDRRIYPQLDDFKNYKRVRSSAGVAFQWLSPIGPLVFSYAKPLKKYTGDEIEQFQFSIGGSL